MCSCISLGRDNGSVRHITCTFCGVMDFEKEVVKKSSIEEKKVVNNKEKSMAGQGWRNKSRKKRPCKICGVEGHRSDHCPTGYPETEKPPLMRGNKLRCKDCLHCFRSELDENMAVCTNPDCGGTNIERN